MAVMSKFCKEITFNVVDINQKRIDLWNSSDLNKLPIFEPGLKEIISNFRGKNLHFSIDIESNIAKADMVFISVNTPTKKKGLGAGQASDLKWVEVCARQVSQYSRGHTIIVEKSTLPVRTAEVIMSILDSAKTSNKISFF